MSKSDIPLRAKWAMLRWFLGSCVKYWTIRIPHPSFSLETYRWALGEYSKRARCVVCGRRFRSIEAPNEMWLGRPGEHGCTKSELIGRCSLCQDRATEGAA